MLVTIDGPAGSGKSTIARKLASRLGIAYLDTGAMYRALAHAALQHGVDLTDERALVGLARALDLELECGPTRTRVWVDGDDVSEAIRTMEVSAATSRVAGYAGVRELFVERQRQIGHTLGHCVSEGRDQGGVVFPDADAKFILDASLEERVRRRCKELVERGEHVDSGVVKEDLRARDRVDIERWQPLLETGVVVVDTTLMTIDEVVDGMVKTLADRKRSAGKLD